MIDTNTGHGSSELLIRRTLVTPSPQEIAERQALVHRILHSTTFGRSERLGALLTFVCDMAFQGRESELNEQRIGHSVFGRSKDYDSSIDGIVRSQASRLRQRLDLYFQHEGTDELLRVSIPRGGYVPLFERRVSPSVEQPALPEHASPEAHFHDLTALKSPSETHRWRWLPWAISLTLAIMLAGLLIHGFNQEIKPKTSLPKHPLWSRLFSKSQPTIVVAPDSGLVIYHGLSGQEIDLKQYLDAGYRTELSHSPPVSTGATPKSWLLDLANRRYTSMVDVEAMLALKDKASALDSNINVRYARDLRPNDFKSGTAILLGMSSANPWVELYEHDMNFVLKDDFSKIFSVINRRPQGNEPAEWISLRNDPQRRVYGVVALVPNLARDGDDLLIEGISMSGTEAAMDFVNDDAQLLPFLDKIKRPDGSIPYFEVLLETHNMGASAVHSQILAWRSGSGRP